MPNHEKHKEEILRPASHGSACFDCLARAECDSLCKERGIDKAKAPAPCEEAYIKRAKRA